MSAADFEDFRDRCVEAWAIAELGRSKLEPRKDGYAYFGVSLGILVGVLGAIGTPDASQFMANLIHVPVREFATAVGIAIAIMGIVLSTIDPRQKSAKAKEASILLGTKQRALETLVDEVRQRTVRGTDYETYRAVWDKTNEVLDQHDVPGAGRLEAAQTYAANCRFRDETWRGQYIGDDSPTTEEADTSMRAIGQEG
ncbi:hypothetical protein [uncultured Tateyamaria sp.]|uniref:hypothetical protein n=1 Tax=Tateyamaria sp. 1078 TaxID=3417464 RepID=UPI00262D92B4|nr:hypothetical protein [uncultured Tateyamaria sp.]